VKLEVGVRVREGVKAVLEEVLEEEMAEHLQTRNLVTPAGKIERSETPRDREGSSSRRSSSDTSARLATWRRRSWRMCLSGISVRKIARVTQALSRMREGRR